MYILNFANFNFNVINVNTYNLHKQKLNATLSPKGTKQSSNQKNLKPLLEDKTTFSP